MRNIFGSKHPTFACPFGRCKIASNQSWSGTVDSFGPENSSNHVKLFYLRFHPQSLRDGMYSVLHNIAHASWWYDCQTTLVANEMVHHGSSIWTGSEHKTWSRFCCHLLGPGLSALPKILTKSVMGADRKNWSFNWPYTKNKIYYYWKNCMVYFGSWNPGFKVAQDWKIHTATRRNAPLQNYAKLL